jgi:hypothetical protein
MITAATIMATADIITGIITITITITTVRRKRRGLSRGDA